MNNDLPCSPKEEIDGMVYFPRLCEKVRMLAAGTLRADLHANCGFGMDQWACDFLGVEYDQLAEVIRNGASTEEALAWAREHGVKRPDYEFAWWSAYMKTRGFRDDFAERLIMRKAESGFEDRDDILTFMDYIDADEGR